MTATKLNPEIDHLDFTLPCSAAQVWLGVTCNEPAVFGAECPNCSQAFISSCLPHYKAMMSAEGWGLMCDYCGYIDVVYKYTWHRL